VERRHGPGNEGKGRWKKRQGAERKADSELTTLGAKVGAIVRSSEGESGVTQSSGPAENANAGHSTQTGNNEPWG